MKQQLRFLPACPLAKGSSNRLFTSVVTWADVWLSQLWSLEHGAALPVSTCMELRCHCSSVCRSSGPPALATLPGLCTVCHQTGLNINKSFPPLITVQYHTRNLESISGADSHHFSTERVCPPLLNWSSIAHCISSVPFHTILFSPFSQLHFLQSIKQTKQKATLRLLPRT